jgi:hypothetical protein
MGAMLDHTNIFCDKPGCKRRINNVRWHEVKANAAYTELCSDCYNLIRSNKEEASKYTPYRIWD